MTLKVVSRSVPSVVGYKMAIKQPKPCKVSADLALMVDRVAANYFQIHTTDIDTWRCVFVHAKSNLDATYTR
jgi:hypothetical protein